MSDSSRSSSHRCPPLNVIGINLIVSSGLEFDRNFTFYKSDTPVINIGRIPSTALAFADADAYDTAWLRCAVVSRKHARIVFSDSGQVYLYDLSSRHGTQILKFGEVLSKQVEPESPAPLENHDIVTFGKSVGRDDNTVRPVSARIELLYEDNDRTKLSDQSSESSYHVPRDRKYSSGRYGMVHSPASSCVSDVAVVGGPINHPAHLALPPSQGEKLRDLGLLKHILPPIDFPSTPFPRSPSPPFPVDGYDPFDQVSLLMSDEDMYIAVSNRPSPVVSDHLDFPSHEPDCDRVFDGGPCVIGAWPDSPIAPTLPNDPRGLTWEPPVLRETSMFHELPADDKIDDGHGPDSLGTERDDGLKRSLSPLLFDVDESHDRHTSDSESDLEKVDSAAAAAENDDELTDEVSKVKDTLDQVTNDVQYLRYSKRKAANHIHKAERKLQDLEKRLSLVDSVCISNANSISELVVAESSRANALSSKRDEDEKRDAALKELLGDIKFFMEHTSKQIADEIEALKVAREEALEMVKTLTASLPVQTTPLSLKRKRSDEDRQDDEDRVEERSRVTGGSTPYRRRREPKRLRRHIVSSVLRTAGVFTVGAVATWSALAFS